MHIISIGSDNGGHTLMETAHCLIANSKQTFINLVWNGLEIRNRYSVTVGYFLSRGNANFHSAFITSAVRSVYTILSIPYAEKIIPSVQVY